MDRICFKVNGVQCSVGGEVSSDVTLLDYLRNYMQLRGTKYMCREGGCGACVVAAVKKPGAQTTSVNACLVSITSCKDWEITTVEQVGNRLDGYHPVQKTLAEYNGTQCGYCTPGWIMSMYSLLQNRKDMTMLEIEKSFGSNICRCTGYRPILEAFKKFAKDAPKPNAIPDIEDLFICKRTGNECNKENCEADEWCIIEKDDLLKNNIIQILLKDGKKWFKVKEIRDIFEILHKEGDDSYMLVAGNTAKGVYPIYDYPRILIDVTDVDDLKGFKLDQNLVVGVNTTLTDFLNILKSVSTLVQFEYLKKLYDHILLVAHIPVRNLGTIAGNLMIKHQHREFPSDIFLLLETIGAQVTIVNFLGVRSTKSMQQFLTTSMRGKVMLYVLLPPLSNEYKLVTFKIMPRSQNAHAIVNAGFMYKISNRTNRVLEARIVYGNLSASFSRAPATEGYLLGKNPFNNDTLHTCLYLLDRELRITENPPEPSADYRKKLALNLFYKGLLMLCPNNIVNARYRSGAINLHETRPVSDGRQIFQTNPKLWPLNQPIPKVEALIQCSGEAPFTEDIPSFPREVFAAFVLSTVGTGNIVSIDASAALNQPGVVAFYTAKDIPGINSFTPADMLFNTANEELLCSGPVKFYNQPIGIIVAETNHIAQKAARMVSVKYNNVKKPVLDIKVAKKDSTRTKLFRSFDATDTGDDVKKVIDGGDTIYGQYWFTMETLVCATKPTEEGLEVHAATQWMDALQVMTSRVLKINANKIDILVRRLGGAYGLKISRSSQVCIACNLVVYKLNRPCRFIMPLTTNTRAVGKRLPCSSTYEVGVNSTGVIQNIAHNIYMDDGFMTNELLIVLALDAYNNCYNKNRWSTKLYNVITDTAKNSWCRSPGTLETIAMAEWIMERISWELELDPLQVRLNNLDDTHNPLREMIDRLKTTAEYTKRREAVDKYNIENRWKKRGLRFALLRWTPVGVQYFVINLSVFHDDGSVVITHSGIEMGQGVNTKAVQVCAYLLKIPIEKVQIKGNNTIIAPNGFISGGSLTSQNVAIGVQRACEELLNRLAPVRKTMNNPTWEELIKKAFEQNVDLQCHGFVGNATDTQNYNIYGTTLAEVEVDILTGESEVLRVDLIEDVGQSVSPEIDIGQIEGAFIMGLGYWTSEQLVYDVNTGELLTDRTWNYHVPQARDIPQDFRVYFRNNSYSDNINFGSKAVGEPPMCMSVVVPFAIREAIVSARIDSGLSAKQWFQIDGPYTMENIYNATATKIDDFKFY